MDERQRLIGKMPDQAQAASKMNDRYLTGLILLLTVVVVRLSLVMSSETDLRDVDGIEFHCSGDGDWRRWLEQAFLVCQILSIVADDRFTYLNTAPYALYLLPTYWRYRRGQLNV